MKKRVLAAAIAAMCFVGTVPVSVVPIAGVAENESLEEVAIKNEPGIKDTITEFGTGGEWTNPESSDIMLKNMTLNDVIELAKKGDELDWGDFKCYNGKDVGSGQYIWEYKFDDGYVLRVIGVTDKKPDYILLSHNNEKGIDIRTEDVKEYIASTATPVVTENEKVEAVMLTTEEGNDGCYIHLDLASGTFSMSGSIYQNFAIFGKFERKDNDLYLYAENGSTNVYVLHREDDHFISQSDERGMKLSKGLVFSADNDAFWEKITSTNETSNSSRNCEDGEMIVPETENGKTVTEVFIQFNDNVKTLKIPATVNKVDIIKCLNLVKIEVSEDNPYLCTVDGVIYSKDMKKLVFYPSSKSGTEFIIPDTVEVIGEGAFSYAQNLKTVKLPDGVKIIKDSAFFGTKITDFELPETLTDIEQYAFSENNSLTSITLPASLKHAESPFLECGALTEIVILHEIGDEHFESSGPRNPDDDYYSALLRNGSNITVFVPDNSYEDYNKYYKDRWKCKNVLPLSKYEKNTIKGDTNCDGSVDMADVVLIMQALANPNKYGLDGTAEHHLTEQGKLNGDMNGDGLTVGDAQSIQRKLLGLENVEAQSVKSFLTANAGFLNEKGTYTLFFIRNGNYFSRAGGSADTHDEGTWTISGDTVVLTGKFGTNRLSFDDNALIYIAEGSDGFNDFNPKDGEKFNAVFE